MDGKVILRRLLHAALLALAPATALAQDSTDAPDDSGWTVTVAPYLWAASLEGTVDQAGLPPIDLDASFSDVFEHLDLALMGVVEAHNGRFGLMTDAQYVEVSVSATTPRGVAANSTEVTATVATLFGAASWRVLEGKQGNLDALGGVRWWSAETEIAFTGGLLNSRSFTQKETWADPMVGAKGRYELGDGFYALGWAMVGGFGVESDSAWDLMGGLGYEAGGGFSLVGGWRALSVDYSDGPFLYDVVQSGPLLGVTYSF